MTNRDSKNIDPMGVNIDPAAETIDMEAFREQYSLGRIITIVVRKWYLYMYV